MTERGRRLSGEGVLGLDAEGLVRPLPAGLRRRARRHRAERKRLAGLEFRTFRQALIEIPRQIVKDARVPTWRILAWTPWLQVSFRLDPPLQ